MRKYPIYKAKNDNQWFDSVPFSWEIIALKHVSKYVKTGTTPSTKEPKYYENGEIDWFTPEDINTLILKDAKKKISRQALQDGEVKIFQKDSLLTVGIGATIGKVGMLTKDATSNQQINAILFNKKVVPKFGLYYFLSIAKLINEFSSTSTMGIFNQSKTKAIYLPVPSPPEQISIVRFLDHKTGQIDRFVANRQKQIELLKEQKAGIINKAVTGKIPMSELGLKGLKDDRIKNTNASENQILPSSNPKNQNSDRKMKPSGIEWIGEIPENWLAIKIKYTGRIINGYAFDSKDFKSSGVRVVKIANIQTRSIEWKEESFVEKCLYDKLVNFRLKKDDLVFALTRPIISTGIKAAIIETNEPMLINQRNAVFRPKSINRRFLYYVIFNEDFIQFFESLIDNTGQQPNISSEDIANITIPFPSLSEQIEIVDFLDARCNELDTLISKYQKQIDLMQEYHTSLISHAVTGKIDVRENV